MSPRGRHHPVTVIVIGTGVLLGLDAIAWALWAAWHLLPWLLAITALALACRRWRLHRRALDWPRSVARPPQPLIRGEVADDASQLRAELARVRGQVARLEDAANRPIEAVIASYERIGQQYGPAATRRTGGRT